VNSTGNFFFFLFRFHRRVYNITHIYVRVLPVRVVNEFSLGSLTTRGLMYVPTRISLILYYYTLLCIRYATRTTRRTVRPTVATAEATVRRNDYYYSEGRRRRGCGTGAVSSRLSYNNAVRVYSYWFSSEGV